MGVYIEEAGACSSSTTDKTFSYPATEIRICFIDKNFRQVKHLPVTATEWF